jgi:RarD protein
MDLRREKLKYVAAVVLYGTIGMFLRYIALPSEAVAFWRGSIGALSILLYLRFRGGTPDREAIRKNLRWLLASGFFLGLNWIFLFSAYIHTTVAIASLCNYMAPIIVVALAPLLLREKLEWRKLLCVLAALIGIFLVTGLRGGGTTRGTVMGLLAALCFAAIVICNKKLRDIGGFDRAVVQLAVSALTILPYLMARNWGQSLLPDLPSALLTLMLGVVHTGAAYCLYLSSMGALPVQTVAILGYLEPVVSVLCSAVFLRESMAPAGWVGAVLIIGAAVASEVMDGRK